MPRKRVEIDVTPQFAHGDTIVCDIEPPSEHHKGGHIRLPKGRSYTLQFNLLPGTPADLHFKPDLNGKCEAFWSQAHECPQTATNAPQYKNARLDGSNRLEVDVDVEEGGDPNAIHYRLNFDDGRSFDPIIIHG
jgi:hypothetical protein